MSRILDRIDGPGDVRALKKDQLGQLAAEIRELLIARVTENGGHLGSNLGVVELTIALHRIFDSPRDKLIWDVGHQSYVHKLLTGRREQFTTLRQYQGLSGFPERAESPHDAFTTGHGGTSVSAALGMALSRDLAGDDCDVVAVIGDGCLTCGMAYEALNHAGHLGTRLIVVLNDNGMSISRTVGALARQLSMLRTSHMYRGAKERSNRVLSVLPGGKHLRWLRDRLNRGAKALFMPSMIWEQLGFTYLGPVNGHRVESVEAALTHARECRGPVIVHVLTTKGKGYKPAEAAPVRFHGIPPRDRPAGSGQTYSAVFARTMDRLLRDNPKLVVVTAAMVSGNGLSPVATEFPDRVYDVGISEQHAVTLAAGLASQGFIPVVAIYSTFLQRAFDQILHDVCLPDLPVVFALDRSGIVGEDGRTHQGIFDLSYLNLMPGMTVCAPRDENELQHMLYSALEVGHPVAIRYPRGLGAGVPLEPAFRRIPWGRGELMRAGRDLAIVAIGSMVQPCLKAAGILSSQGIDAAVADARFVKPLDVPLILELARNVGKIVTVEENVLGGGFGAGVLQALEESQQGGVKLKRLGIPDDFVPQGGQDFLRSLYRLDAAGIASECAEFLSHVDQDLPRDQRTGVLQY